MRVLMVNKFLHPNGGSETYIFKLGQSLTQMGNTVQYFGMEHPDRIVGNAAESYTSSMDFHTGKLKKIIYPFKIIYSFEARRKIRRVLEDFNPEVVHLNNFNFQLTPSIIYEVKAFERKNNKKITIIYTAHDYQWVCPNHMMQIPSTKELCMRCIDGKVSNCTKYKCIHNSGIRSIIGTIEAYLYQKLQTYQYIDRIICPSEFMAKVLSHNPLLKEKTMVLHNFIDKNETGSANEKIEQNLPEDYILYFGRYSEEKGIRTLLDVCKQLPEIPFVFAGSGPLENQVNGVQNVSNKGFLSGGKLKQLITQARFIVFPSEWYENCPFSVMEAQMYETPVLGADIGGTPELIRNMRNGELFSSGNEDELRDKIQALWKNKEKCQEYSNNCKDLSFDSLQEYSRKLLEIYKCR